MRECEWAIVRDEVNPYVSGQSRIVAHICHVEQMSGKIRDGKVYIPRRSLGSDCHIVELPDGLLEIQLPSVGFSAIHSGPYRIYSEIQREIERYTGCQRCQIMDLARPRGVFATVLAWLETRRR